MNAERRTPNAEEQPAATSVSTGRRGLGMQFSPGRRAPDVAGSATAASHAEALARHGGFAGMARQLRSLRAVHKPRDIEQRVLALALATIRWGRQKPSGGLDRDLVRQMVRATTSVGANLEEARAAETKRDFTHKASLARKEALEACYWARLLLADAKDDVLAGLASELNEVAAILTTIVKRSRQSARRGSSPVSSKQGRDAGIS